MGPTGAEIEKEIEAKGLTAPRMKPADLDAEIVGEEFHVFPGSQMTVCCLTLKNGYNAIGTSACVDPRNFDAELGRKIARKHAWETLWPLLGFRLADQRFAEKLAAAVP